MSGDPSIRIVLRPIGSPVSLGLSGLAVASLVQSGVELHWTPAGQTAQAGLILIAVPFVVQLISSVLTYVARDGVTAAAIGLLSVVWLAVGLLHVTAPPGARGESLGLLLLAAGGVLAISAGAIALRNVVPAGVFGITAVRFVLAGVYQLGGPPAWERTAGIAGLVVTGAALYAVLATELEQQLGHPVLPTLRRDREIDDEDGTAIGVKRLVREPGVRDGL